jgi:hypothetical protein
MMSLNVTMLLFMFVSHCPFHLHFLPLNVFLSVVFSFTLVSFGKIDFDVSKVKKSSGTWNVKGSEL